MRRGKRPHKLLCSCIHTVQCIQAAGGADERQALRNDLDEKLLVIAQLLILAAALRGQKTTRNHFTLLIAQTGAGVIITEAVISQPVVDVTAFFGTGFPEIPHSVAEDINLCLRAGLAPVFGRGSCLPTKWKRNTPRFQHLIDHL